MMTADGHWNRRGGDLDLLDDRDVSGVRVDAT